MVMTFEIKIAESQNLNEIDDCVVKSRKYPEIHAWRPVQRIRSFIVFFWFFLAKKDKFLLISLFPYMEQ